MRGNGPNLSAAMSTGRVWLFSVLVAASCAYHVAAYAADIDVWVDPGHGDTDPGALGFNQVSPYPEKTATLEVGSRLKSSLESIGYSSLLTRYIDIYPTLFQRIQIADGQETNHAGEQATAQIFVSVHMNSTAKSDTIRGTEVQYSRYRAAPKLADQYLSDKALADVVYSRLIMNTPAAFMGCNSNRGVKAQSNFVNKWTFIPSILVE